MISKKKLYDSKSVHPATNIYSRYVKRLLDIVLSLMALVVLSPLLIIVSILELVFHGYPILYHTNRPGKNDKIFKLYKFRTMTNKCDKNGKLLPDKDRLTKFGHFIRKYSIDELPELFNILNGDMSIIGPRPLLIEYLDVYTPRHHMRNYVRPGLACAKINKKPEDTWTWGDQFENDIYYIEHLSFATDIKMLFAIIREIISADEFRAGATRVPLTKETLFETRSLEELDIKVNYNSIDMNGKKKG